jgi:hypothetical protein
MPLYIEFRLAFVIARSRLSQPFAHRRLNAFENTLSDLAAHWRPIEPIVPDRELRMCSDTRESLMAWIQERESGQGQTLERIAAYALGVVDESVGDGWVRLMLAAGEISHAL